MHTVHALCHAVLAAALAVTFAAGAPLGAAPPDPPALDLASARIVDLTHAFDEATLYWPNAPSGFKLTSLAHGPTPRGFFYAANSFCAPEHGGTHLDAPSTSPNTAGPPSRSRPSASCARASSSTCVRRRRRTPTIASPSTT